MFNILYLKSIRTESLTSYESVLNHKQVLDYVLTTLKRKELEA